MKSNDSYSLYKRTLLLEEVPKLQLAINRYMVYGAPVHTGGVPLCTQGYHTESWILTRRHKDAGIENPALRYSAVACQGPRRSLQACAS